MKDTPTQHTNEDEEFLELTEHLIAFGLVLLVGLGLLVLMLRNHDITDLGGGPLDKNMPLDAITNEEILLFDSIRTVPRAREERELRLGF